MFTLNVANQCLLLTFKECPSYGNLLFRELESTQYSSGYGTAVWSRCCRTRCLLDVARTIVPQLGPRRSCHHVRNRTGAPYGYRSEQVLSHFHSSALTANLCFSSLLPVGSPASQGLICREAASPSIRPRPPVHPVLVARLDQAREAMAVVRAAAFRRHSRERVRI